MSIMTKYHGWISVLRSEGYADRFVAEHDNAEGEGRIRKEFQSPAQAVEYFDKRAGEPVLLTETPLGAYRVYTAKETEKVNTGKPTARDVEANHLRNEAQRLIGSLRSANARRTAMGNFEMEVEALCNVAEKLAELTK